MNTRPVHHRWHIILTTLLFSAYFGAIFSQETASGQGKAIPFSEKFALSENRQNALKQLVPGSNEHYFYNCLYLQQTGQLAKVDRLLDKWKADAKKKSGFRGDQIREIYFRQLLLKYPDAPKKTLAKLARDLNLYFNHQPETIKGEKKYPTKLDPKWGTFKYWRQRYPSITHLHEHGLFFYPTKKLSTYDRQRLLKSVRYPDFPRLVEIIAEEIKSRKGSSFGNYPIHRQLTLKQMDQLLELTPRVRSNSNFVSQYLQKLAPNNDTAIWRDEKVRRKHLDDCWKFAKTLPPSFTSLKANILYWQLHLDRKQGIFDKKRFKSFLAIPRHVHYLKRTWRDDLRRKSRFFADLNYQNPASSIGRVGNDEKLVRFYLEHYLENASDTKEFRDWIEEGYLNRIVAELKLVRGKKDAEKWSHVFSPQELKRLNERVDLEFAPTTPDSWDPGQKVELNVTTKAIKKLIVKVFYINSENFYRQFGTNITTDINLDGLVPSYQKTHDYDSPSILAVERKFSFPQCAKPGIYVIDFIGNGKSSRALIKKGKLEFFVKNTPAGHRLVVLDQKGKILQSSKVWIDGRWLESDKDGDILIPYTSQPGTKRIVVSDGSISSFGMMEHLGFNYQFDAGLLVNRESLLPNKKANLVIKPTLHLNGRLVSLEAITKAKITLTAFNQDNIPATKSVSLKLSDKTETTVPVSLEEDVNRLTANLSVTFTDPISGNPIVRNIQKTFSFNQIDKSVHVDQVFLVPTHTGYFLEIRGKSGEDRLDRPINISLYHRLFRNTGTVTLQTDSNGRIELGHLAGIRAIAVSGSGIPSQTFTLDRSSETYQNVRHALAGQPIKIPYSPLTVIQHGKDGKPGEAKIGRFDFALFEIRSGRIVADHFKQLRYSPGQIIVNGLAPGDYQLHLKQTKRVVDIKVSGGKLEKHLFVGKHRILDTQKEQTATISKVAADEEHITIKLDNWSDQSRVVIVGNRFFSAFQPVELLRAGVENNPSIFETGFQGSSYVTGRAIGDEYDYILRRKLAIKYPGLLLPKPSLLLNPFKVRQTNNQIQVAAAGGEFEKKSASRSGLVKKPKSAQKKKGSGGGLADYSNMAFLGDKPIQIVNLKPNKDGVVKVPAKQFANKQSVKIILVDGEQIHSTNLAFSALNLEPLDLRFQQTLDSSTHFSQNKTVIDLSSTSPTKLHRNENPKVRVFNELKDVYQFYLTKSNNANLRKFRFITKWNTLKEDEKKQNYSQHACHELNFFLRKKDPKFFEKVIAPYLSNKYEKTFMDRYLLEEDLTAYLTPQQFGLLNYFEQILLVDRLTKQRESLSKAVRDRLSFLTQNMQKPEREYDSALAASFGSAIQFNEEFRKLEAEEDGDSANHLGYKSNRKSLESAGEKSGAFFARPGGGGQQGGGFGGGAFGGKKIAGQPLTLSKNMPTEALNGVARFTGKDRDIGLIAGADKEVLDLIRAEGKLERGRRSVSGRFRYDEKKFNKGKRQQRFQPISPTYEWAENNYFHQKPGSDSRALVRHNRFWLDYCNHVSDQKKDPFLSHNFLEVGNNFTELMFALAVTDLPLDSQKEKIDIDKNEISIQVEGPSLGVLRRLEKSQSNDPDTKILVSENFIRMDDPTVTKNGIRYDKFVTKNFYTHVVYMGQVAVTNPTSSPRSFQLLVQIPEGSMPVRNGVGTKTVSIRLNPYSTTTFKTYFYFPRSGEFPHYPAQVSKDRVHLANGKARKFLVKKEVTKLDPKSWTYIARYGTEEQVLEFLAQNNLWKTPLNKVAYRLKQKSFYEKCSDLLKARHFNDITTNSYSLLHNDKESIKRYLRENQSFRRQLGPYFQSDWLTLDYQKDNWYHHREYWPLVNSRFHQLGTQRRITNPALFGQYNSFLERMIRKHKLDSNDYMAVCYYLLVQDRYEEALQFFSKLDRKNVPSKIQYDYLAASFAMVLSDTKKANDIAKKYLDHPVKRWRSRFQTICDQILQIENPNAKVSSEQSFGKDNLFNEHTDQSNIANDAPSFDFVVQSNAIELQYRNLKTVKINFYQIDLELLFSRTPFQKTGKQSFDWVKPNESMEVKVDPKKLSTKIDIPKKLQNKNLLVETSAGGSSRTVPYYSRAFDAQFAEAFGQLRVTDKKSQKPISKIYVKVYALMNNGKVQFFKDGYTDLRGRFDYVTQNNVPLTNVRKLSVLVLSKDKGAFTKELNPPAK